MAELTDLNSLWSRLLAQDSQVAENEYHDYREKLTRSLGTARRYERIAYWVCAVSGVTMFLLMFVGGSGVVGGFDPWDKDATVDRTKCDLCHFIHPVLAAARVVLLAFQTNHSAGRGKSARYPDTANCRPTGLDAKRHSFADE